MGVTGTEAKSAPVLPILIAMVAGALVGWALGPDSAIGTVKIVQRLGKDKLYRIYREEGLGLRRKRPWRHVTAVHREVRAPARHRNDVRSMDFVHDHLADGRKFRTLTVIDVFTRECLEIEAGQSLKAEDVVRVMERLKYDRGVPARIYCDNGSEFVSG